MILKNMKDLCVQLLFMFNKMFAKKNHKRLKKL